MFPRIHESELTGRARARPGWFGKQVLQVEVRTLSFSACPPKPGSDPQEWREKKRQEGTTTYHWRDATWQDLTDPERLTLVMRTGIEPSQPWPRACGNVNSRPDYPPPPAPPSPPPVRRRRKP